MTPLALVTGATSGIGQLIADRLVRQRPGWHVVTSGPDEAEEGSAPGNDYIAADLSSLAQVRQLAAAVIAKNAPIALLVLAAGQQRSDAGARSSDGFELTFAVNTLANVALLDALIQADRVPARVLWFSSGTHDPAKRAGLPTPRHAEPELLAYPERDDATREDKPSTRGARAYTASKLAATMLAYAYARDNPNMKIDAFDPQLTPGTGLARYQSRFVQLFWHNLLPAIVPLVPFMNRAAAVADAAVATVQGGVVHDETGRYIEVRRGIPVVGRSSEMSYDIPAQERLLAGARGLIN
ncbi:MAG TPA: SDR family NAD(P)-dependent oxidoreductase [Sphingomonadaceae bacterium]|nr:SDR family NAD(P)-dependent oxidoreductase [Sphingomonadaceae bacterium]